MYYKAEILCARINGYASRYTEVPAYLGECFHPSVRGQTGEADNQHKQHHEDRFRQAQISESSSPAVLVLVYPRFSCSDRNFPRQIFFR